MASRLGSEQTVAGSDDQQLAGSGDDGNGKPALTSCLLTLSQLSPPSPALTDLLMTHSHLKILRSLSLFVLIAFLPLLAFL